MRILVTGASGTIGTRLCERLLQAGHDAVGADRRPNEWRNDVDAITIQADLLRLEDFSKLPTDVDIVVHLAAHARVYDLVQDPTRALENTTSLFQTLEWARTHNIKRFIFASSRECYGNVQLDHYTEDQARISNCESPYTASKLAGEAFVTSYDKCYDINSVILRFSNVYGAYDNSNRVVPLFINRARRGEALTIFGKEKDLDFTYIDDTVHGIMLAIEQFDTIRGQTLNLASGTSTTLVRCAEAIKELTGSQSPIEFAPPRVGEVTHYTADITAAGKQLGYEPQVPFEEGIRKAVDWYAANMK